MSFILNAVYNNYLSTYTPKSMTRYDSHKKSELRNVCNTIVQLNKESPWYLPTTNKETQHYAVDLKENARGLRNTLAQLGGLEENGLLNKKSAFSTNSGIATATYIGTQDDVDAVSTYNLEVETLASPQENMGRFLPDGPVELPAGSYSFDVAINDLNYEFQFSINEGESNRDIQERLTRLINNADIRLKASIIEDESMSALRLVSESTGLPANKSQFFLVSDEHTSKQNGTVDYLGLDYVSRNPSDAHFRINGESHTSTSNRFTIDRLFEVELHGLGTEDTSVRIGLKTDTDSITDNIVNLVGGYNDFIKAASSYIETQKRSKQLIKEFSNIASLYNSSMETMGLNLSSDGTLSVDKDMLRQSAMGAEDITETFGYLKSFSTMLIQKSNQISLDPMEYVDKTVVAYKNPHHNFVSPYAPSAYSGMMFNGYC